MENNLAVLIDFENIAAGTEKEGLGRFDVDTLMQRIKDKGRILVARSYADWGRFSRFKQSLLTANVTMMELTSHGMQDKNRADIAMVVDALELAFTRAYVDTFVVVSGDSDFTPLVLKMRELNKRVIGIGTRKSTSRLLIQACDEFMYYDTIVQPKKKPTRKVGGQPVEVAAAFNVLEEALDGLQRENPDPPHASIVKSAVLRKSPDFDENDLGFSSFARFLEAAQDAGVVRIIRDTKSGGYRVDALGDDDGPAARGAARGDDTAATEENGAGTWSDEYIPAGTERFLTVLEAKGLHPLATPTRMAVLTALEEIIQERDKKRRKTTLQFVRDDLKKKLRRTHPELPQNLLKGVLDALMAAGELMHRDGTAIRSTTAPFTITKDAEELNESLVKLYLSHLREAGVDLSDSALLAELFYGNAERRRQVEENVAYLVSEGEPADLDLDLDDLLLSSSETRVGSSGRASPVEAEPARPAKAAKAAKAEASAVSDLDSVLEVQLEPASDEGEPKKRKRTRRKKGEEEGAVEAAPAAAEKPTRSRRKKEEPAPSTSNDDLDALLESQPHPRD